MVSSHHQIYDRSNLTVARKLETIADSEVRDLRAKAIKAYQARLSELNSQLEEARNPDRISQAQTRFRDFVSSSTWDTVLSQKKQVIDAYDVLHRAAMAIRAINIGDDRALELVLVSWPNDTKEGKVVANLSGPISQASLLSTFKQLNRAAQVVINNSLRDLGSRILKPALELSLKLAEDLDDKSVGLVNAITTDLKVGLNFLEQVDHASIKDRYADLIELTARMRDYLVDTLATPIKAAPLPTGHIERSIRSLKNSFMYEWSERLEGLKIRATAPILTNTAIDMLQSYFLMTERCVDITIDLPLGLTEVPERELQRAGQELIDAKLLDQNDVAKVLEVLLPPNRTVAAEVDYEKLSTERHAILAESRLPAPCLAIPLGSLPEERFVRLVEVLKNVDVSTSIRDEFLARQPNLILRPDKLAPRLERLSTAYAEFKTYRGAEPTNLNELWQAKDEQTADKADHHRAAILKEAYDLLVVLRRAGWSEPEMFMTIVCEVFCSQGSSFSEAKYIQREYVRNNIQSRFAVGVIDQHLNSAVADLERHNVLIPRKNGECLGLSAHPEKITDDALRKLLEFYQKHATDPSHPLLGGNSIINEISSLRGDEI